jgi:cytochrome b561
MQQRAGKFAFFCGIYLIIVFGAAVTTATGEPIPVMGWPLLLIPAASFQHSSTASSRVRRSRE